MVSKCRDDMVLLCCALALAPTPKITAWLDFWDGGAGFLDFEQHARQIREVSIVCYTCQLDGSVVRGQQPTPEQSRRVFAAARKAGTRVFALTANAGFSSSAVEAFIKDPARTKAQIDLLVSMAKQDGFDGIDIDFESLSGSLRDAYSSFIEALATKCHANGLKLAVAVHAKLSEPGSWDGTISQDWHRLGTAVDEFRIMGYDLHWSTSEAGPVGPIDWVTDVAKFAVTQMPASRVEIGFPGYGYDWVGKKGTDITWTQWQQLLKDHGPAKRDDVSKELVLTYADHTAYYPDSVSSVPKLALAKQLATGGLVLWVLGAEDPKLWDLLSGK